MKKFLSIAGAGFLGLVLGLLVSLLFLLIVGGIGLIVWGENYPDILDWLTNIGFFAMPLITAIMFAVRKAKA